MIYNVIIWPDKRLLLSSKPVAEINNEVRTFCANLVNTMLANDGAGISAVQVGRYDQIIVVTDGVSEPYVMINPTIVYSGETEMVSEGCLSIPGIFIKMKRSKSIWVNWVTPEGVKMEDLEMTGILAQAVQHEVDHLSGKLLADHFGNFRRATALKKLAKLKHP